MTTSAHETIRNLQNSSHTFFSELSGSLLRNKHLRELLQLVDGMVVNNDNTSLSRNFIINTDEASLMSPVARLGYELTMDRLKKDRWAVEGGVVRPDEPKEFSGLRKSILDVFKTSLPNDIINNKVTPNIYFSTTQTTLSELKSKQDNTRAQSVGFGEMKSLSSFLVSPPAHDTTHTLKHTPTFFVSILQNINSILDDTPLARFKSESKQYLNATLKPPFDQLEPSKAERLSRQREHVVRNIAYLTDNTPSTISLYQYAASCNWHSSPITTNFDKKEIMKLAKFATQPPPQEGGSSVNLESPPSGTHPLYFNCFLCPPFAKKCKQPAEKSKNKVAFLDPSHGDVNINRLIVRTNVRNVLTHYTRYHTDHLDPSVKAGHGLIIPCNICRRRAMEGKQEYLYYMYSCCLEDLRTHYFLLHNDDDLLLKLYNTVRQHIVTENLAVDLKLCDSYFLSRCLICGHLFPSQLCLLRHEKICLSKIVSCSSFFGLRLVEDLFCSKYTKKASEEESNLHIVNQASLFLKRLRNDELTNPTSSKNPTITKTTTTGTENQPKPKPKPKPFEEYLSETYGQFVIRRCSKSVKQANPRDGQPSTNHLQTIYKPVDNRPYKPRGLEANRQPQNQTNIFSKKPANTKR